MSELRNKKYICKTNCCVFGCSTRANRDEDITFNFISKKGVRSVNICNNLGIEKTIDFKKAWELILKSRKSL